MLPLNRDFDRLHKQRYLEPAQRYDDRAYDAIMVLADAYHNTHGSVEQVREYLQGKTDYTGFTGRIQFDRNGDVQTASYQVRKLSSLR